MCTSYEITRISGGACVIPPQREHGDEVLDFLGHALGAIGEIPSP